MADMPKFEDTEPIDESVPKFEDTEEFVEETPLQINEDIPGQLEAGTRAVGQGLTFGFMDEAAAALQAGLDVATSDKEVKDLKQLYQTYKQLQSEREKQAQEMYPKTALVGEIAGSIPTSLTPTGAATTVGKAVKLGALYGLGKSEADLTKGEVGKAAVDTALGAGLGYAGGKAGEALGKGLSKLGSKKALEAAGEVVEQKADDLALGALAPGQKVAKIERGGASSDVDYRRGIGKEASKYLSLGGPEAVRSNVNARINEIESIKKPLLETADRQLKQLGEIGGSSEFLKTPLKDQLNAAKEKVISSIRNADPDKAVELEKKVQKLIDSYQGKDNDILALNQLKKDIGTVLTPKGFDKPSTDLPEVQEFMREAGSVIRKRMEDLADLIEPNFGKKIKELNFEESNLLKLRDVAFSAEAREAAKQGGIGLSDLVTTGLGSAVGMATGGPIGATLGTIGALGAKKGIEKATGWGIPELGEIGASRITKAAGKDLKRVGDISETPAIGAAISRPIAENLKDQETKPLTLSQNLYNAPEEEIKGLADMLEQNQQFSAYGKALKDALENKSSQKKNAVLFSILQNPNMRKLVEIKDK